MDALGPEGPVADDTVRPLQGADVRGRFSIGIEPIRVSRKGASEFPVVIHAGRWSCDFSQVGPFRVDDLGPRNRIVLRPAPAFGQRL